MQEFLNSREDSIFGEGFGETSLVLGPWNLTLLHFCCNNLLHFQKALRFAIAPVTRFPAEMKDPRILPYCTHILSSKFAEFVGFYILNRQKFRDIGWIFQTLALK